MMIRALCVYTAPRLPSALSWNFRLMLLAFGKRSYALVELFQHGARFPLEIANCCVQSGFRTGLRQRLYAQLNHEIQRMRHLVACKQDVLVSQELHSQEVAKSVVLQPNLEDC